MADLFRVHTKSSIKDWASRIIWLQDKWWGFGFHCNGASGDAIIEVLEHGGITRSGWEVFLNVTLNHQSRCPLECIRIDYQDVAELEPILCHLLCDKSDIDSIFSSNHVLVEVCTKRWSEETRTFVTRAHWNTALLFLLKINDNADKAGRFWYFISTRENPRIFKYSTECRSQFCLMLSNG